VNISPQVSETAAFLRNTVAIKSIRRDFRLRPSGPMTGPRASRELLPALCQMPSIVIRTLIDRELDAFLLADNSRAFLSGLPGLIELFGMAETIGADIAGATGGLPVLRRQVPLAAAAALIGGQICPAL